MLKAKLRVDIEGNWTQPSFIFVTILIVKPLVKGLSSKNNKQTVYLRWVRGAAPGAAPTRAAVL
jgi:hypothetical protein